MWNRCPEDERVRGGLDFAGEKLIDLENMLQPIKKDIRINRRLMYKMFAQVSLCLGREPFLR